VATSAIFGQHFLVSLAERILTHVTAKTKMAMRATQFTRRRSGSAPEQGSGEKYVPLALVTKAHESADRKVRKVELMTATDGIKRSYTRPVNEVILLRNKDELNPKL
jgi:hypothetical protein